MRNNLGQRTNSSRLQNILAAEVKAHFKLGLYDYVIVHHYTDKPEGIQIEYEIQFEDDQGVVEIEFGRLVLE